MKCSNDCNQGKTCDCREPFTGSTLDMALAVVAIVFALSCIGYLIGGIR